MTVDELLANPAVAVGLPNGAVPVHALIVIEYANPGADKHPDLRRLTFRVDDAAGPWQTLGWARFVELETHRSIRNGDYDGERDA